MSNDFKKIRLDKLEAIKSLWYQAYPSKFNKTHFASKAKKLNDWEKNIRISGRIMLYRTFWSLAFATILDQSGKVQIAFQKKTIWGNLFEFIEKYLDLWDFIGVVWEKFTTKHWEPTILAEEVYFLWKALLPLPEKFHWLQNEELQYRKRHLDLIMNEDSMQRFKSRTWIIRTIRRFLESKDFEEIETPILSCIAWWAAAKPFHTHHNALDIPLTLRIAPELYLKRAIVWGYDRVFEFAKCFRNEWIDPSHLQEFTMLEFYQAYADFNDTMHLTEELFNYLFDNCFNWNRVFEIKDRQGSNVSIDFKTPWPKYKFRDLILERTWIDILIYKDSNSLLKIIKQKNIILDSKAENLWYWNLCDSLYKKTVRPHLISPCFVTNHPLESKPLARVSDDNPLIADTYQLLVNTWEIVNAYSELVDPIDQKERLITQAKAKAWGDDETFEMDEDYIEAMEYWMPPISWWWMWIDRLVTLLLWRDNLKDCILFPVNRPVTSSPLH